VKLLAIDIGASGGKAVLGEPAGDRLEIREIRRFTNGFVDINGHKHWNILSLLDEVKACLLAVPDADSVGIDTWGVDYGYVDSDGDILGLPFAYRDARTESAVGIVHAAIPFEKLYELTGIQHLPFNTIYQIADDLVSRPWLVENADKLLMIPELLGCLLTGEKFGEYTNASTSGLLDVNERTWSKEILDAIGFPIDHLPKLIHPGKIPLSEQIAKETGSHASFCYVACHDTASAVAGIPVETAPGNWAYISSGTWSLVGMELDHPIVSNVAREANFTNEGGVGGKIRFLKNVTGLWILEELRREWQLKGERVDFDTIIAAAEKAPTFRSIINPDHVSFVAPDNMRDVIREYCRESGQTIPDGIGPLSRCVFESLAMAYNRKIEKLSEITGLIIDRIHVIGGGSRNQLLCQMTADACGIPVIAGPVEAASIGNILVQAISNGLIDDIGEGRRLIKSVVELKSYEPMNHNLWEKVEKKGQVHFIP
jgi:rhamnulokinase